ncbi:hypothetical protein F4808DRAFT_413886 [Astrocystis sublimbata]|nr:hypothetical protein F4808DRAFT_413886 [Astrocystis sublimbata]
MSAPGITYSGVLAKNPANDDADADAGNDGNGGVFRGLKFWLSRWVPLTKFYADKIRSNGGTVVLTEGRADILICDPKHPIPNSYSYEFIMHAVREGSLDSKGIFLCTSSNSKPPKATRNQFTAEDDRQLMAYVTEKERLGETTSGNEIYQRFADDHTRHTWHSWRDRWVKKLKNLPRPQNTNGGNSPQPKSRVASHQKSPNGSSHSANTRAHFTPEEDENGAEFLLANHKGKHAAIAVVEENDDTEIPQKNFGADDNTNVAMPQARWAGPAQSQQINVNKSNHLSSPQLGVPQSPGSGRQITTRDQFYRDYNIYLESSGAKNRPVIPSVAGKSIALWDLWQSIPSHKKVEATEIDWEKVAEDLGFDWVTNELVADELKEYYRLHLAPFADGLMDFEDSSDEECSTGDMADAEAEKPLPSSPPELPLSQRLPTATNPAHQHIFSQPPAKRRRLDRQDEILSTPERTRTWRSPSSNSPMTSPINPLLHNDIVAESIPRSGIRPNARNGEDDAMSVVIAGSPAQTGRKRRLEPETQDFQFDPETQLYPHNEASDPFDIEPQDSGSPSQPSNQRRGTISPVSQHIVVKTTPTPRRRIQSPFQLDTDDSNDDELQQTSKSAQSALTPVATQQPGPNRRTLPASWVPRSPIPAQSPAQRNDHSSSAVVPESEPHRRPAPPRETPDDIIGHFVSLGYTREIALRSLKATSWIIGNARQVMEILKQGEPLPPTTTGVWTQHDDEALALVHSNESAASAKAERKRAKAMRRLQAKHGEDQIILRKKYLLDNVSE